MSMSAFQKMTLAICIVLCVALLLPKILLSRGKKDAAQTESPGHFPPMANRQMAQDHQGQRAAGSQFSRAHNPEAIARAKGAGTGAGTGGKSNLAGQIIPIYGFGILVYILYILFKITSKGNIKPTESRFPSVRSENMKRKITDFELSQLQEKLKETEMVMEKIVSKASNSPERVTGVTADQEESLLLQLREITRVMQEGHLVEGVAPEKKPEDWEDLPGEHQQCWEGSHCTACHHVPQSNPDVERNNTDHCEEDATEDHIEKREQGGQSGNGKGYVDMIATGEKVGTNSDLAETDKQGALLEKVERGANVNLSSADENLVGVQKLELTLKMTTVLQQDHVDLTRPVETSDGSAVRRRNRKKRTKHDPR